MERTEHIAHGESDHESPHALAIVVAYDGTALSGFARQPGRDTVQGRVEHALSTVLRRQVQTVGAGRTDAGVHALGQVLSIEASGDEPEPRVFRRSLDALTGEGVIVREVRLARAGFSARFDAVSREYRYRIVTGPVASLFIARWSWHVSASLDVEAMREAATHLIGEHDFKSFCVTESAIGKRTVRRVDVLEISEEEHLGERCVTVRVVGNAFLHSMVRVIVGSLVEVGCGRREPGWLLEARLACDRAAAGPTAPAAGLTFHEVRYPDDVWLHDEP